MKRNQKEHLGHVLDKSWTHPRRLRDAFGMRSGRPQKKYGTTPKKKVDCFARKLDFFTRKRGSQSTFWYICRKTHYYMKTEQDIRDLQRRLRRLEQSHNKWTAIVTLISVTLAFWAISATYTHHKLWQQIEARSNMVENIKQTGNRGNDAGSHSQQPFYPLPNPATALLASTLHNILIMPTSLVVRHRISNIVYTICRYKHFTLVV